MKCNTGKVFGCFNQFSLTMVLSIEERVFLVEYVFREGNRYTDLVREKFAEDFPETPVPHRNAFRRLVTLLLSATPLILFIPYQMLLTSLIRKLVYSYISENSFGPSHQIIVPTGCRLGPRVA